MLPHRSPEHGWNSGGDGVTEGPPDVEVDTIVCGVNTGTGAADVVVDNVLDMDSVVNVIGRLDVIKVVQAGVGAMTLDV